MKPPLALRIISATPGLNRIPARLLGLGVRREHVAPFIRDARAIKLPPYFHATKMPLHITDARMYEADLAKCIASIFRNMKQESRGLPL